MDIQLRELNFEIIFLGDDFNIELSDDPIILEFEHEGKETIEDNIEKFLLENLETLIKPFIPVLPEVKDGKTPKKWIDYFDWEDWKTPVKWIDYFTKKELSEIRKTIKEAILSEIPKIITEDEINVKFDDILKKIKNLPTWGGWALFLRQLMDVNVGNPTAQQYWLTYNPSRSEFSLTTIDSNVAWWQITWTLSNQTDLQSALDAKVNKSGDTMTGDLSVPDEAYWAWWNGSMGVPTKNALYDKIETISPSIWGNITSGTKGSVLFIDPASTLAQDNRQFYYDFTFKRLSLFSGVGSEQLTNPNFTGSATGWTVPAGMAYSSNSVSKTSNGTGALTQSVSLYNLREYQLTYTISNHTAGTITPSVGSFTGTAVSANGTYTERFVITSTAVLAFTPSNTARFTIDSVSIVPMIGTNTRSNLNVGGISVEGNWSNGSPGTTRAMTFNNDGSNSWIDYRFAGTLRAAAWVSSSWEYSIYSSGGNYLGLYSGNSGLTVNQLYCYIYPTAIVHTWYGAFASGVNAGSSNANTSTLQTQGGTALKTKIVTENTTLDNTATHWLADASSAACTGTPSVTSCSTYTGSGQATCESHLPCSWFAGSSCGGFSYEYGMGTCTWTSWCSADTTTCSWAGDQTSCESQDDSYGGSCAWTLGTNTCPSFGDYTTCDANSPCYSDNSGDCNTLSDGGGDGTNCATQPQCSYDSGTGVCSGNYFTSCAGDNSVYSCTGDYYTGNCSGTYGASCNGTATCGWYVTSGACTAEAGCTWATSLNLNLPDGDTCPDRTYWIKNDSTSGADVVLVPYSGQTVEKASTYTLTTYQQSVHIAYFKRTKDCSVYTTAGACTPTWCTANYSACSWDSGSNICSGNVVCDGIGDQMTCEWTTYFTSCTGNEILAKNWYIY